MRLLPGVVLTKYEFLMSLIFIELYEIKLVHVRHFSSNYSLIISEIYNSRIIPNIIQYCKKYHHGPGKIFLATLYDRMTHIIYLSEVSKFQLLIYWAFMVYIGENYIFHEILPIFSQLLHSAQKYRIFVILFFNIVKIP